MDAKEMEKMAPLALPALRKPLGEQVTNAFRRVYFCVFHPYMILVQGLWY